MHRSFYWFMQAVLHHALVDLIASLALLFLACLRLHAIHGNFLNIIDLFVHVVGTKTLLHCKIRFYVQE
jgi:hypothetical protein